MSSVGSVSRDPYIADKVREASRDDGFCGDFVNGVVHMAAGEKAGDVAGRITAEVVTENGATIVKEAVTQVGGPVAGKVAETVYKKLNGDSNR